MESLSEVEARAATEFYVSKFRGGMISSFMGTTPIRDWVVKGAMLARCFYLVVGEPGSGKSFLTLDLAMTRALAAVDQRHSGTWFGRKVKPGGTVYIAGEGQDDFIIRMHAWLKAKNLPIDLELPVYLCPAPIDLRSENHQTASLIAEIKQARMLFRQFDCGLDEVVVDTVNKSLAGGDDCKPEHVGAFLKNCFQIRDECETGIIGVHHTPKPVNGKARSDPRGHSSWVGDNDGQWFVSAARDGAPNAWTITRNKAGPSMGRHEFRLRQTEIGLDQDREPITSCVVVAGASEASLQESEMRDAALQAQTGKPQMTSDGRSILGDNLTMILRALQHAIDAAEKAGDIVPATAAVPHGRMAVKQSVWTEFIVKESPGDEKESDKFKERCRKARDAAAAKLRNRGIIGIDGDYVFRTSKRVAMVDAGPKRASAPEEDRGGLPPGEEQIPF